MESFCGAVYQFMSTKTGLQQAFSMLAFIRDRYSPLIPHGHQKVLKEPSRSISQITQGSVCPSPPQWLAAFLRKIQNQINSVQNGLLEDGIKRQCTSLLWTKRESTSNSRTRSGRANDSWRANTRILIHYFRIGTHTASADVSYALIIGLD